MKTSSFLFDFYLLLVSGFHSPLSLLLKLSVYFTGKTGKQRNSGPAEVEMKQWTEGFFYESAQIKELEQRNVCTLMNKELCSELRGIGW